MGFDWHIVNVVRLTSPNETLSGIEGIPEECHNILDGTRGWIWARMLQACTYSENDENFICICEDFCESVIEYEPDEEWCEFSIEKLNQLKAFCKWYKITHADCRNNNTTYNLFICCSF